MSIRSSLFWKNTKRNYTLREKKHNKIPSEISVCCKYVLNTALALARFIGLHSEGLILGLANCLLISDWFSSTCAVQNWGSPRRGLNALCLAFNPLLGDLKFFRNSLQRLQGLQWDKNRTVCVVSKTLLGFSGFKPIYLFVIWRYTPGPLKRAKSFVQIFNGTRCCFLKCQWCFPCCPLILMHFVYNIYKILYWG